ncbi:ribosome maturation factor RimP [Spelaeicoccus albus]|uniref:Ribosome maturation factor RimP n=1 Tax=Spelaeicoccus albus TaxID=1280376 RepID=A0A7Z0IHS5_9MICO|nr:ribosome maturation factor RimP [Spelaeicoccus albus]NYI67777.1 ribosome maturation factor RimP [Spelaeicoccus albus]
MRTDEEAALADRLGPLVHGHGLVVEDLKIGVNGSRRSVTVTVDLPEDQTGAADLDTIAQVSKEVGAHLDDDEPFDGRAYTLEVSSPGATRPLTEPRHWKRARGRLIAVKLAGGDSLTGRLIDVADDGPQLDVGGASRRLAYGEIASARVEVEFK